jgi:hypothetical protein
MIRDLIGLIIALVVAVMAFSGIRSCQRCVADGGIYVRTTFGFECAERKK